MEKLGKCLWLQLRWNTIRSCVDDSGQPCEGGRGRAMPSAVQLTEVTACGTLTL